MPSLTLMIKPASGACNMHCGYCFYMDEMDNRSAGAYGYMGGETAGTVIRRALIYAEGSVSFVFQGGEPTLVGAGFYRDWLSAVKQQNTRGLQVTYALQTNALELTDDMLSVLKEGNSWLAYHWTGMKPSMTAAGVLRAARPRLRVSPATSIACVSAGSLTMSCAWLIR